MPHWALACRQNRIAEVYPVTHLNGQNLYDIKGRQGRPARECFIIVVPRVQIFDSTLKRYSDEFIKSQALIKSPSSPAPGLTKRKLGEVTIKLEQESDHESRSKKIGRTLRTYSTRSQPFKENTAMFVQGSSGQSNDRSTPTIPATEPTPLFLLDSPTPIRTPTPPPQAKSTIVFSPPSAETPGGLDPWRNKERRKANFNSISSLFSTTSICFILETYKYISQILS
ncbi:hypothetical protein QCA50_018047 [Cerrena zonata]|uniref:Uncharacterized protein n=1 Tax=Cerrena zonata TaxID=2478898 RepID=A0AAW0FF93_9APHY